jgi:hypothetical protein
MPTGGGGSIPEPELDRLSNILRAFNDQFGNIEWKDADKIRQVIAEEIPTKVASDKAYQNAMKNNDKPTARVEHDRALQRVLIDMLADHTELYKQFSDNPAFKRWLTDTIFTVTYAAPDKSRAADGFRLRIIKPRPEERYVSCVPFVPLKLAAGAFGDGGHIENENWEWAEIESKHRLRPGMFVAQVVGKSMEPAIPDGSYCLFASPVEGSRQGKTVLVQLRDSIDPETGERYTVKRYHESEKVQHEDSWRHAKITLKPANPAFPPIELTEPEAEIVRVIAECIEVLGND